MKCSFCDSASINSFEIQAGNGAEIWLPLELCQVHDEENQRDESKFERKYSEMIDAMAAEWSRS